MIIFNTVIVAVFFIYIFNSLSYNVMRRLGRGGIDDV